MEINCWVRVKKKIEYDPYGKAGQIGIIIAKNYMGDCKVLFSDGYYGWFESEDLELLKND